MSIRVFIVAYQENDVLNRNLRSLWAAARRPEELHVTVLANHPDVEVDAGNQRDNLVVTLNRTRSSKAWGCLARDWNAGLIDAFVDWTNPRGVDWCILAPNDVEWIDGWDDFLRGEDRFDMITQACGSQVISLNIHAVRKIGMFDERFTAPHFHELDFGLRGILALVDRASVNDDAPSTSPAASESCSWNPIGAVLTQPFVGEANVERASRAANGRREMRNLLLHKWGVADLDALSDRQRFVTLACSRQAPPQEIDWYPSFWEKMPGRRHALVDQYADIVAPTPPGPRQIVKSVARRVGRTLQRTVDKSFTWLLRRRKKLRPPAIQIDHPLNQPPVLPAAKLAAIGDLRVSDAAAAARPPDLPEGHLANPHAARILAVVQGPFFRRLGLPSTYEVIERLKSSPRSRIDVAVAVWDNEARGDIRQLERLADFVHVLTPPSRKGTCHRNWQCYGVAAALEAHQHAGYAYALKCRSDMLLSDKLFIELLRRADEGFDKLCVTNLFTRWEPFHISDMLVFSRYEHLQKYFGDYELFYEDLFSPEVEYSRGYIRARGLKYYHTFEDYCRFLKREIDLLDFDELGIAWLKHPRLTWAECSTFRMVLLDRDSGPLLGRLVSTKSHRRLQKAGRMHIRANALLVQVADPIMRRVLLSCRAVRQCPYFVYESPEFTHTPAKRVHPTAAERERNAA